MRISRRPDKRPRPANGDVFFAPNSVRLRVIGPLQPRRDARDILKLLSENRLNLDVEGEIPDLRRRVYCMQRNPVGQLSDQDRKLIIFMAWKIVGAKWDFAGQS